MSLPPDFAARLAIPVFVAPMYRCSGERLAVACCQSGLVGSLTANNSSSPEELEAKLKFISDAKARFNGLFPSLPFGPLAVNLSLRQDGEVFRTCLKVCRRNGVELIVTSIGDPTVATNEIADAGLLHFHDATSLRHAEKAIAAGVNGIICIGSGGGGHAGTLSPMTFVPKVRAMFGGTIALAGAVGTGAAIRAAEVLGADLAYMGTRFIATEESDAPLEYKRTLVTSRASDLIYTAAINGLPASWLTAALESAGLDSERIRLFGAQDRAALPAGRRPWVDIWSAGQSVEQIEDVPSVAQLVRRLKREYHAASGLSTLYRSSTD